jgi:hypothetical protein
VHGYQKKAYPNNDDGSTEESEPPAFGPVCVPAPISESPFIGVATHPGIQQIKELINCLVRFKNRRRENIDWDQKKEIVETIFNGAG